MTKKKKPQGGNVPGPYDGTWTLEAYTRAREEQAEEGHVHFVGGDEWTNW